MNSAKSAIADQESKDKKMIDKGTIEAKRFISTQNFDSAAKILSSISPASRRLNYKGYEIAILNSFLNVKQYKWKEAKSFVQTATRLRPDDPTPWKLMIQVESESGTNDSLRSTLHRALETSSPDGSLLTVIGPYLKKYIDDDNLTSEFIRLIEIIPDGLNLPVADFIPENPKTVDIRTRMLEKSAANDEKSCSDLIHILLDEDDPFKAMKYAKILPPEHIDRIYVETLIGDDPLNSARKHVELGSNRFRDFLIAADSHNLVQLRTEVNLIPPFVSGWTFLANLERDPKIRIQILTDAIQKFPHFLGFRKLLADAKEEANDVDGAISAINFIRKNFDARLGSEMLIKVLVRTGRCKEAASLLATDGDIIVSDFEKATIEFELFKEDHDTKRLRRIIDLPESAPLAGIKAEAAWELRSELRENGREDEVERLFAAALRCDRQNGRAYLMFGKWQMELGRDAEKAAFLLEKSAELGCVDSDAYEIVTRKYITSYSLEATKMKINDEVKNNNEVKKNDVDDVKLRDALKLLGRIDTEWSHFRAALIHQRLGDYERAAAEFQLDLRFNPERDASWSALGHSYVLLGRALAAKSVAEHLREVRKSPDLALEFELANIFGQPIAAIAAVTSNNSNNENNSKNVTNENNINENNINENSINENNINENNENENNANSENKTKFVVDLSFKETPRPFHAYLVQTVEAIRRLRKLGRTISARQIVLGRAAVVRDFAAKWLRLSTVLKTCGDFFVEAFLLTHSSDFAELSLSCYKSRCESDKRAESFIDLAHSLQLLGRTDAAASLLRRVLKAFPDHAGLWTCLGVTFALLSKFPFARHCLCVAAKLATEVEQARSFSCLSAVAMLINDSELLEAGVEAARRANPFDPDVWQILMATSGNQNIEAALISFQFSQNSTSIIKTLPELYLRMNKPLEALGFSLMIGDDNINDNSSNEDSCNENNKNNNKNNSIDNYMSSNNSLISRSFEALGRYDLALLYEKDENRKKILKCLMGKVDEKEFPNIGLYIEGKTAEAAEMFIQKGDFYSKLAAAICFAKSGDTEKALIIFTELKESVFAQQIEKIMLQVLPNAMDLSGSLSFTQKDPELFFLEQIRLNSRIESAKNLIKRFPSDTTAMEIFVVESLKSKSENIDNDAVLTKARALNNVKSGVKTLVLLTCCLMRAGAKAEAVKNLQIIAVLRPKIASNIQKLVREIVKENDTIK